ncbi:MAG: filamentous hemagglutinin N-terminal domain-containing protein [Rivularia sp. (in: cyanobacteria)]
MFQGLKKQYYSFCFTSFIISGLILPTSANAQKVSSDGTLPTRVTSTDNLNFIIDSINNSNRINNNLFHSFKEFSIPTDGSAVFNNSADVVNIINRVTGGNISNIDGLIKANGSANVFLINPNGIVFGQNAALDIGGSFIGTTANSIEFANGWKFSADDTYTPPLLTINMPLGLQMGQNPGAIQVNGYGHDIVAEDPIFTPYFSLGFAPGLKVKTGNTLALVGSDISLNGGSLTAASGRIELGSLGSNDKVELNSIKEGFKLKYNDISNYKDIQLNQNSLLNVSGEGAGSIQVRGRNIDINNGSIIWGQNSFLSFQPGGDININASEVLSLNGMNADETLRSSIVNETIGFGASGNINISAKGLSLQNGTAIENRTYTPAPSGNININTTEYLVMLDASPKNSILNSLVTATYYYPKKPTDPTASTAIGGDVNIKTQQLSMQNGSFLATQTYGDGSGGNIQIDADAVELSGANASVDLITPTSIASIGYRQGNSGTIKLNTSTLSLKDGGTVSTTNLGTGNAGKVLINAIESVEVTGNIPELYFASNISSTVGTLNTDIINNVLNYIAIGDAGDVTISTPNLKISDYAGVSVANYGIGTAGMLKIDADSVELNQGTIEATTISGEGGNIVFNLQEKLLIRNNSTISAEAGSTGNGGNITIDSPVIVGVENSDIIANAFEGNGGNIDITTQGIFGLQFREKLTEENDITASSEFGVNGVVKINNLNVNPTSGAIELPNDVIDSNQQIASGCSANSGNSFAITGKGGFPTNPNNIQSQIVWNDLRKIEIANSRSAISHKPTKPKRIVEATGMVIDAEGNVEFVAQTNGDSGNLQKNVSCAGV